MELQDRTRTQATDVGPAFVCSNISILGQITQNEVDVRGGSQHTSGGMSMRVTTMARIMPSACGVGSRRRMQRPAAGV